MARTARRLRQPVEESNLHVGGLSRGVHRCWLQRNLHVGDRAAIVVAKSGTADRPLRVRRVEKPSKREKPMFLNVDLDIRSVSPLDSLVNALGPSVFALYVGRERRRYAAHLETAIHSPNPDRLIRRMVGLVRRLPRMQRSVWNRAELREFNIGIQSAAWPTRYEWRLDPATVRAAASVHAAIGVTVYGHAIPATAPRSP